MARVFIGTASAKLARYFTPDETRALGRKPTEAELFSHHAVSGFMRPVGLRVGADGGHWAGAVMMRCFHC